MLVGWALVDLESTIPSSDRIIDTRKTAVMTAFRRLFFDFGTPDG